MGDDLNYSGGRDTTPNPARDNLRNVRNIAEIWKRLQEQYPEYTKRAYLNFLSDKAIKRKWGKDYNAMAYGDATPSPTDPQHRGQIVFNSDYANMHPTAARDVLLKELGQVNAPHMLGTPERADAWQRASGYDVAEGVKRYPSGLGGAEWNGDTMKMGNHQINIGGYQSFPEDTYGIAFGAALGSRDWQNGRGDNRGLLHGQALAALQQQGLLPRRASDPAFEFPAQHPRSQDANPMMASYMARRAQVNEASADKLIAIQRAQQAKRPRSTAGNRAR